jgi:hypothetical protein
MTPFFKDLHDVAKRATNPVLKKEILECYKDIYKWIAFEMNNQTDKLPDYYKKEISNFASSYKLIKLYGKRRPKKGSNGTNENGLLVENDQEEEMDICLDLFKKYNEKWS